jgi:hypothetical protein
MKHGGHSVGGRECDNLAPSQTGSVEQLQVYSSGALSGLPLKL